MYALQEVSPWWLASPQFQEKVVDSAPLRRPPLVGSKTGLERGSSGFTTDTTAKICQRVGTVESLGVVQ